MIRAACPWCVLLVPGACCLSLVCAACPCVCCLSLSVLLVPVRAACPPHMSGLLRETSSENRLLGGQSNKNTGNSARNLSKKIELDISR